MYSKMLQINRRISYLHFLVPQFGSHCPVRVLVMEAESVATEANRLR